MVGQKTSHVGMTMQAGVRVRGGKELSRPRDVQERWWKKMQHAGAGVWTNIPALGGVQPVTEWTF